MAQAKRVCRLVEHKDDGVLAVAFAPGFFDTTPPAKLEAAFYEARGALGRCGEHMAVLQRARVHSRGSSRWSASSASSSSSIGLDTAPFRPMMTLGLDMRPGSTMADVRKAQSPP